MSADGLQCCDVAFVREGERSAARPVLANLSACFPGGSLSLVAGPTGSGKTTLLHLLAGLLRPTAGEIRADGRPVSRWTAAHRDRWRRGVGIVFQVPMLMEGLTVLENVMLPLVPRGGSIARLRHRALEALAGVELLALAGQRVAALSGGQRQRVCLARALVADPRYLLADEPTSHQDAGGLGIVTGQLARACRRGAVVVASTHDPRLQDHPAAQTVFELSDGRLRPRS